jgi:hypothetical protein
MITGCDLEVADHPDAAVLVARYFAERDDGLRPQTVERLLTRLSRPSWKFAAAVRV